MKKIKISEKEIKQDILNEALVIKRKKELFKEAQKINEELKQLNEYGHPGVMSGYGFKDYTGPSPVIGLVTPSNYEEKKPEECGCKLDQFPKLEKDIEEFGGDENDVSPETSIDTNEVQVLKSEVEELKSKLAQFEEKIGSLNEAMSDKLKK
jgi:FtsZ-binding cell division protein ZapB